MKVLVKKLHTDSIVPSFGSEYAAGADLYAYLNGSDHVAIPPHATIKVGTGVAMAIPTGYYGGLYARSGLACKRGLAPANKVGVVDSDYRGEFMIVLYNHGTNPQTIQHGERIAQLVITPVFTPGFIEVAELTDTQRSGGGFGSTGK